MYHLNLLSTSTYSSRFFCNYFGTFLKVAKSSTFDNTGGDTRVKAIKSDSDSDNDEQKKGRQVFQEKNRGVTPSVAAPGVTRPSDATDHAFVKCYTQSAGITVAAE